MGRAISLGAAGGERRNTNLAAGGGNIGAGEQVLETVVAAEQEEIEQFFSLLTSRSKVREAVNALLQARELSFVTIGTKTLIRMTPPPEDQRRRNHG